MKKEIGMILIFSPFLGMFLVFVYLSFIFLGKDALKVWGFLTAIFACFFIGVYLINF